MLVKKDIENVLKNIPDPEINISIWDLGLIYNIDIDAKKGKVDILMTLTTLGCPLFDQIAGPIKESIGKIKGVKQINVDLTFEPPWSMDKMSDSAKIQLGFN